MLRRGAWVTCLVTTSLEDLARAELSCVEGDDFEACSTFPAAVSAPALLQRQKATTAISSVVAAAALEERDEHEQQPSSVPRKDELVPAAATAVQSSSSSAKPSALDRDDERHGHKSGSEAKGILPPSFFQTLLVVNKERRAKHQAFDALSLEPDAVTAAVAVISLLLLTAVAAFLALRHRSKVAPSENGQGSSSASASASKEGKQAADGNLRQPIISASTGETGAEEDDSDSDSDTEIGCTGAALFDGPMWDAFGLTPQSANASGPMAYRSIAALQLEEKVARQGDLGSPCVGDVGSAPETGCAP